MDPIRTSYAASAAALQHCVVDPRVISSSIGTRRLRSIRSRTSISRTSISSTSSTDNPAPADAASYGVDFLTVVEAVHSNYRDSLLRNPSLPADLPVVPPRTPYPLDKSLYVVSAAMCAQYDKRLRSFVLDHVTSDPVKYDLARRFRGGRDLLGHLRAQSLLRLLRLLLLLLLLLLRLLRLLLRLLLLLLLLLLLWLLQRLLWLLQRLLRLLLRLLLLCCVCCCCCCGCCCCCYLLLLPGTRRGSSSRGSRGSPAAAPRRVPGSLRRRAGPARKYKV